MSFDGSVIVLNEEITKKSAKKKGPRAKTTISLGPYNDDAVVFVSGSGRSAYRKKNGRAAGILFKLTVNRKAVAFDDSFEGKSYNLTFRANAAHTMFLPRKSTKTISAEVEPYGESSEDNQDTRVSLNVLAVSTQGKPGSVEPDHINVKMYGAIGDGNTDDTAAIKEAISSATDGCVLFFPKGNYKITDTLVINKRLNVLGVGHGSQIFQQSDKDLFLMNSSVEGISFSKLFLGSAATSEKTSLIRLENAHRNHFEHIIMLGSYYGVYLKGALLNNFISLKSSANIGGFFAADLPNNRYWVYGERCNNISANANTFIGLCLEGGTNGIWLKDPRGEGSLSIFGGTIEGCSRIGLYMENSGQPSVVSGTHFEGNGVSDIVLKDAAHVAISSVFSDGEIKLVGASRNNTIDNSLTDIIRINSTVRRTVVSATETNIGHGGGVFNDATDTIFIAVSGVNPFDWFGTIGIGTINPNSNPIGLTPHLKLDVKGNVRAGDFLTDDIKFHKDGELLWRMFEDDDGLLIEHASTGAENRLATDADIQELRDLIEKQDLVIADLLSKLNQKSRAKK